MNDQVAFIDTYTGSHDDLPEIFVSSDPIPPTATPSPSPTPIVCDYSIQSGDVSYLAQSIEEANATPESFENICLATEGSYNVESPDMSGYALPAITGEIAIFGNGSTLTRDSETTEEFGILRVENSGTLYLSNLTIRNGYNSAGSEPSGGAISNAGIVVVTGSTLENNTAVDYGGAIFNTGTLTLIDSAIAGNTALNYGGGGIRSTDGSVDIINSEISGNSAGWGGGVDSFLATIDISGSTISDNQAEIGGGIFNLEGELAVTGSVLSSNRAFVSGGAALDSDGAATISESCIYDNDESTGLAVVNQGEETLAAENNFWGTSDGPSGSGLGGFGDAIGGDVDAEPFLSTPPNACASYVPDPTDTPEPTDTTTPTPTPTFTATPTETPTASYTPTFTPTNTPTATSTPTATFTPSHTPTPTMTPTPLPQEGWLTFVSKRPAEGSGGIAVWNVFAGLESGWLVQLTDNASTSVRFSHPVWSPDHARIAFAREVGGAFDLCMLVVATRAYSCDLTVNAAGGNQRTPAWSPGGDWLAYASDHDGDEDIYRVAIVNGLPSGTAYNLTTRATNDGNDSDPDWHGDWIVYQTDRDGNLEIFAMFADADAYDATNDGQRRQRLTTTDAGIMNFQPAWSPNGNRIAYTTNAYSSGNAEDDIVLLAVSEPVSETAPWTTGATVNVTANKSGDWRFTAWKKNDATQNVIAVIRDLSVKQLVIVTLNPLTVTTPAWSISGIVHDDPDW